MVELMADILRNGGPTMKSELFTQSSSIKPRATSEVNRKKEAMRIAQENKFMADRLRKNKPVIDHEEQEKEYIKATANRKKISEANKRAARIAKERIRKVRNPLPFPFLRLKALLCLFLLSSL